MLQTVTDLPVRRAPHLVLSLLYPFQALPQHLRDAVGKSTPQRRVDVRFAAMPRTSTPSAYSPAAHHGQMIADRGGLLRAYDTRGCLEPSLPIRRGAPRTGAGPSAGIIVLDCRRWWRASDWRFSCLRKNSSVVQRGATVERRSLAAEGKAGIASTFSSRAMILSTNSGVAATIKNRSAALGWSGWATMLGLTSTVAMPSSRSAQCLEWRGSRNSPAWPIWALGGGELTRIVQEVDARTCSTVRHRLGKGALKSLEKLEARISPGRKGLRWIGTGC